MTVTSSDHPDNVFDDVSDADQTIAATEGVIPSEEGSKLCQQLYTAMHRVRKR
jgi:hypothetical protein